MNAKTINDTLSKVLGKKLFRGVYASNELATLKLPTLSPWCVVLNTAPSTSSGEHWVAVLSKRSTTEFFCSYGSTPFLHMPQSIQTFLRPLEVTHYNGNRLQQQCASTCGQYCIMFLIFRALGLSFDNFLAQFSPHDLRWNDYMVTEQTRAIMHGRPPLQRSDLIWARKMEQECHQQRLM